MICEVRPKSFHCPKLAWSLLTDPCKKGLKSSDQLMTLFKPCSKMWSEWLEFSCSLCYDHRNDQLPKHAEWLESYSLIKVFYTFLSTCAAVLTMQSVSKPAQVTALASISIRPVGSSSFNFWKVSRLFCVNFFFFFDALEMSSPPDATVGEVERITAQLLLMWFHARLAGWQVPQAMSTR